MLSDGHLLFYTVLLRTFFILMYEKLDELLKSIDDLKSTQWQNQRDTTAKLNRLEQDNNYCDWPGGDFTAGGEEDET